LNGFGDDALKLKDDIELIHGAYDDFQIEDYLNGTTAPVFFGSAVNNFGVKELLDSFVKIAPQPLPRETTKGLIEPETRTIFRIHI
jgi:peptide chain release factor 3